MTDYRTDWEFRPNPLDYAKKEQWKEDTFLRIREVVPQNDPMGESLLRQIRTIFDKDSERNNPEWGLESNKVVEQKLHEWELAQ